ncbi:hypothetical protein D3C80_1503060 [compost metagenome]
MKGWASEVSRFGVKLMKPADREMLVEKVLTAYGQRGTGSFTVAPPAASGDFVSTVDGRTENLVNLPGPVGVPTLTSLAGGISQNVYSFTLEKQRSQSFVCISNDTVETSRFEFPAQVNVLAIPKPVQLHDGDVDYSARYSQEGNAVVVERRFKFSHPDVVCSPDDFMEMKPVLEAMIRDLQSQIIVQAG